MRRPGELVDRQHRFEPVPAIGDKPEVPRQGRWIAGHGDHHGGRRARDCGGLRSCPGARRVEHETIERGKLRVGLFYEKLDRRLGEARYLAGDRFTVADITAFTAISLGRIPKIRIAEELTNLQRWFDAVRARPSVG